MLGVTGGTDTELGHGFLVKPSLPLKVAAQETCRYVRYHLSNATSEPLFGWHLYFKLIHDRGNAQHAIEQANEDS